MSLLRAILTNIPGMQQGDTDWHASRLGCISGSGAAHVMGTAAARERYLIEKAVEIVTGNWTEIKSKYLAFGHDQEPHAIRAYEFQTGLKVESSALVTLPWNDRIICSPDGLVEGMVNNPKFGHGPIQHHRKGVVEAKSRWDVSKHVKTIFTNQVPKEYVPQCHWNMWVTCRQFCDYVSYCPDMPAKSQLHVIRVNYDEEYTQKMQTKAFKFLQDLDELVGKLL